MKGLERVYILKASRTSLKGAACDRIECSNEFLNIVNNV